MEFKHRRIALSDIDFDDTEYRITTPAPTAELAASIQSLGLIDPPILIARDRRYTVVAGFRRIDVCRQLGRSEIQCRLMAPGTGPDVCAMVCIADNAMQRDLNLIEQANAITLLSRIHGTEDRLVQAAQACGLAVNGGMVRKLLVVGDMASKLQQAILDGGIAFPIALQLARMKDSQEADAMVQLLLELRLGLNRQREMVESVGAIARRDDRSIVDVLTTGELGLLRQDTDKDPQVKSQMIRRLIRILRYPTLTQYEARYAQTVKSLKLKPGTQLQPPPHFEGQTYALRLEFQSYDDLLHKQKEFERLLKSQAVKKLWSDPS